MEESLQMGEQVSEKFCKSDWNMFSFFKNNNNNNSVSMSPKEDFPNLCQNGVLPSS